MSFTTSSSSNPCPICGDTSGKCRHHHEGGKHLCMNFVDLRKGEVVDGYKCTGTTKCGIWAMFAIDNSQAWTEEQRREWQQRKEERQREQQVLETKKAEDALSLQERDKQYRELLASLPLKPEDRADLKRRGFTDLEIDLCGIKSVSRYQELQQEFSHLLPGVSLDGKFLLAGKGYLIPVRNSDNLIVACQVRLSGISSGGRYRWLSSKTKDNPQGQTPHVYGKGFAELPLSIHRPQGEPIGIALAEGTGVKPFKTSQHLNLIVIGAAGGQWCSSRYIFEKTLNQLSTELSGTKTITIFPDAGDVVNQAVMNRWQSVISLLQNLGWTVKIGWWGQFTKESDDIDELEEFSNVKYISPEEFFLIVDNYRNENQDTKAKTENVSLSSDWAWQQWLRSRKFTPDIVLNQEKFRFPEIPDSNVIIAAKSGLGTGKTEALLELIRASNRGSHLIGYRNNLLFQTINRGGNIEVVIYHLREDDGHNLVADEVTNQAFCLDSIHHVDGYFAGKDIYLDETCSVLLHAVNGGTLGDKQAKVIKIFTHALQECNKIILLDGNLADIHVDFIAKLAPSKRVIKIENQRKIAPHTIKFIECVDIEGEVKKRDKSALIKTLCSEEVTPWIVCDSKDLTNVIDNLLKQSGRTGLVLNADTAGEDWAKQFLNNPNSYIAANKPQYFIGSPTIESGVSVTISNYFTHKFSFFAGIQGTNSQHQQMFRLRDNSIPHYVFCPERSMVRDRSNPNTYSFNQFKNILDDRTLLSSFLASQSSENPQRVIEVITEALKRNHSEWFNFSCQLGVLDNYEMDNLRKCLIHALEDAGHRVEIEQWEISEEFKAREKETKEFLKREYAQELFAAIEYNTLEEAKQVSKSSQRKETQRRVEKTYLLDRIPGIKDNEIWGADFIYECYIKRREFITQQQRFWLVNNIEVSQKRHEADWFYKATQQEFFSASVKRMGHGVIWGLQQLNIMQFANKEYHKDSPEVIEFIEKLRQRKDVQTALRYENPKTKTTDGKERIEIIGNLLQMIGFKNKSTGKKLINGIRYNCYTAAPSVGEEDDPSAFKLGNARLAILESIESKFIAWMESDKSQVQWDEEQLQSAPEAIATTPRSLAEIAAEQLEAVQHWSEVRLSQEVLNAAWQILPLSQQKRLEQLYQQWQQEQAIATQESNVIDAVDAEIKVNSPFCNLEQLPAQTLWVRRLSRAQLMSEEIAKELYNLLPSSLLNNVWQQLTLGIQDYYVNIFAT